MATQFDLNALLSQASDYMLREIFAKAVQGDPTALVLAVIYATAVIVSLVLLAVVAARFAAISKRILLTGALGVSAAMFALSLPEKALATELSAAVAAVGVLAALLSIAITMLSIKWQLDKKRAIKIAEIKKQMQQAAGALESGQPAAPEQQPQATEAKAQPAAASGKTSPVEKILAQLHDSSPLAAIAYTIAVQLGVLSGIVATAPDGLSGTVIFTLLLAGGALFTRNATHNFSKGMQRYLLAFGASVLFSIALTSAWLGVPLETLLTMEYFKSRALSAFAASFAVGLLMGTKD